MSSWNSGLESLRSVLRPMTTSVLACYSLLKVFSLVNLVQIKTTEKAPTYFKFGALGSIENGHGNITDNENNGNGIEGRAEMGRNRKQKAKSLFSIMQTSGQVKGRLL